MLNKFRRKIDETIVSFLKESKKNYPFSATHPLLFNAIYDFSTREGKRIRPLLFILSYLGYTKKKPHPSLYKAAISLEFLHLFMLIHDDIIDHADLRRGKPTMHRLLEKITPHQHQQELGHHLAIIAGDIVYAMAMDAFQSFNEDPQYKRQAFHCFLETTITTALGEFIDTLHGVYPLQKIKEKDVFLNYSFKTARYTFIAPLMMGAILGKAKKDELQALASFGLFIGQAFQIQDDIIGIYESESTIGKSILSDLEEQKKTLLIIHAHQHLKGSLKKTFLNIFNQQKKTLVDLKKMQDILIQSGSLHYAVSCIQKRKQEAQNILKRLSIKKEYKVLIEKTLFKLFNQTDVVIQKFL